MVVALVCFLAWLHVCAGEVSAGFRLDGFAQAQLDQLALNGIPDQSSVGSLQLTSTVPNTAAAVWFKQPVLVRGFCSNFTFSISDHSTGMAFVIQTANKGTAVVARNNGPGLGYGTSSTDVGAFPGIPESVAVEFDTFENPELADRDNNHLSVHTLKNKPNTAYENLTIVQGYVHDGLPSFVTPPGSPKPSKLSVSVCYRPWQQTPSGLTVSFAGQVGYALHSLPYPLKFNLSALLDGVASSNGQAYIGFTATTGPQPAAHILYDWSYEFLGNVRERPDLILTKGPGVLGAVAGAGATFGLLLVDQFRNPYIARLPDGAITVLFDGSDDPALVQVQTPLEPPPADGVYMVWYNATRTGRPSITVEVFGNQVGPTGEPLTPLVTSAAATAADSYALAGPGFHGSSLRVPAGQPIQFLVQTVDRFGNNCTDTSAVVLYNVTSVDSGQTVHPAVQPTSGPGQTGVFAATITLNQRGHYSVDGWVNGARAPALALAPNTRGLLSILNLGPVAFTSTVDFGLAGGGNNQLPELVAGRPQQIVVTLRDQYGNALIDPPVPPGTGYTLGFLFNGESGLLPSGHHCDQVGQAVEQETQPGVFLMEFQCRLAGRVDVDVRLGDQSLQGMPFPLQIVSTPEVDPAQSLAWGTALEAQVPVGPQLPFSFQPVDPFGNNITVALLYNGTADPHNKTPLQCSNDGKPFPLTVAPLNNGVLAVTYDSRVAQTLHLHLQWNGRDIQQPQRVVTVVPGPTSAAHSLVKGPGLVGTQEGLAGVCLVEARDQYDNAVPKQRRDFFQASIAPQSGKLNSGCVANVTNNHNGTYSVLYVAKDAGVYLLNITLNGQAVAKSPYSVVIEWGGFSNASVLIVGSVVVLLLILAVAGFFTLRYHKRKQYFNL